MNPASLRRTLVFGGARSGKSAHAERLALAAADAGEIIYLATAAGRTDAEMQLRIEQHRARRDALGGQWRTVQEPMALGRALREHGRADNVVLVDCLTVWLSNLLFADGIEFPEMGPIIAPTAFTLERVDFLRALQEAPGRVILVSNEVGMGIVPQGAVSRWFVDEAGRLNQSVAAVCEQVHWVAAGLPLSFKGGPC
ncbi:bifunctional adenosylcobinamide kinase/adenosylcobinamide-phosphate guanylyltransferase [Herbaspirillum sp. alder98]|uniref:bifunctional adenosylcobinamide kinase/adenosylcobinamide-phosphate guanylyltransferase n=1 Tax=Herbaspirillum sp. alder98 TaxID=2913096 RepID=UPI001CD8ABCB|nr:bifunctional adenosylcobinamide kinase/adenosylcobinamide-phosphate guanylyltransferase [Herbaspirillum sp. alder98]MCA1326572.1 bifunctional adenosylcobinamide kinase/adenosylcobinamide-phosphate guanylyltransferase [Herbaspirillum sp. alder98]